MMIVVPAFVLALVSLVSHAEAFAVAHPTTTTTTTTTTTGSRCAGTFLSAKSNNNDKNLNNIHTQQQRQQDRRSVLSSFLLSGAAASLVGRKPAQAEEIPITPFNGLIFNYRSSDQFTGLDASTLNEPSVPFLEFGEKLKGGQVAFVEFLAPDGDAAYVTFKPSEEDQNPTPIRIGEGYPTEQHDGWSSPAFVVRALQNYNVPYKFTIPALAKFRN
eukprot:CAMPEP_0116579914 /NCGR_PEP_ID=MMETSP0397-20121206/22499_1 /TAXON_ID=216820 /ORGANISM="Cyclophora tenuis, Strain ECT3854" /LENGTH=215 /DNA_ID=CAMNT_0004109413 /DNA_START=70 /DNA_END=717 /DNA_ORIENTATION=+